MLAFLGGFRATITASFAAFAMFVAMTIYDRLVDDPAVARAARENYVRSAQLEAANAKIAELARQLEAGQRANQLFAELLAQVRAENEILSEQLEQDIARYEALLAADGRSCVLDQRDLEWLR